MATSWITNKIANSTSYVTPVNIGTASNNLAVNNEPLSNEMAYVPPANVKWLYVAALAAIVALILFIFFKL